MPKKRKPKQASEANPPTFITLDDVVQKASELKSMVDSLSQQRRPLAIRRGIGEAREEVMDVTSGEENRQLKGSSKTFFFDVESTKDGEGRYLRITESRKDKDGKWQRNSIIVFAEDAQEFAKKVAEFAKEL